MGGESWDFVKKSFAISLETKPFIGLQDMNADLNRSRSTSDISIGDVVAVPVR